MEYISLIANTGIQISDFKIKLNQENFRTLKFNYYEGLDSRSLKYWFEELIEIRNLSKFIRKGDLNQFGISPNQVNEFLNIQRIDHLHLEINYE